ncbi:MAG: histidine kinase [Caldilineaceae bacterium]
MTKLFSFGPHTGNFAYSRGDRGLVLLARLGAVLGTLMVLATALLWLRNGALVDLGDTLGTLGDLLMALICCVVAGLILGQRPRQHIGWLLLAIGLLWATEWFGEAYGRYAYVILGHELPGVAFLLWLSSLTWVPGFGLVIWLILLFPDGRPLSPHWRWIGMTATVLTLTSSLYVGFFEWSFPGPQLYAFLYGEQPRLTEGQQRLATTWNELIGIAVPLTFLLLLPAAFALFLRLRRAQGLEKQQIKWFAYGVLLLTVTMLLLAVIESLAQSNSIQASALPALWEILYVFAPALLPITIGIAILRYRLWDIDLLIRRTLVYALLTTLIVAVYVSIIAGVGTLLTTLPAEAAQTQPGATWPTLPLQLVAAGAVAVLFQPARHWLQQRVNRLFYGEIDEPYAVVARLGQQLEATLAPQTVLATIVETVRKALKLPYAVVRVANSELYAQSGNSRGVNGELPRVETTDGADHTALSSPQPEQQRRLVTLPLVHQGEYVGELLLAPRLGEESFSAADRHLLEGLARQAGAAIQAVRLTADLQLARQRLVAAREEERRRLRRDLHDALGASLASIAMQADAARTLVDEAPEECKTLLHELTDQAQTTLADIRRLIYNLRPPALDDLGLVAALSQLASTNAQSGLQIEVQAPDPLPNLPAAVEVAAYRIVQEAMTNVVRHAQAQRCVVHIAYCGEETASSLPSKPAATLKVEICDDGIGLSAQRRAGVGTSSMRERAEELGGTLLIAPQPTGGTRVAASLPIE